MSELVFFSGTMDCGKSTLALQLAYNRNARGLEGLIFSRNDRAGEGRLSSRLGLDVPAIEVTSDTNIWKLITDRRMRGERVDFLVCDEVQFYSVEQVEQLARIVDEIEIDVFGFGITTDFRTKLFAGSARMMELADRVERLQVEALCWCGARATHNARTVGGLMVTEGEQIVVGDTGSQEETGYEVLCRKHHLRSMTAALVGAAPITEDALPLGETDS
ncbi:MAG: thymidine kinase [Flaviflexus sp.]|uniref:thymidine kinase n=1 Tax=Flaviflexus sp. TaxID=1969482 RepID=UPI00352D6D13